MSAARTLYRGGSVYSPADPFATAMLVDGGFVAWVGSDEAAAGHAAALGPADRVVDLDGALVTPAFVDAHVHVTETGLALASVDLSSAAGARDVLDAVAAAVRTGDRTILGWGWEETAWAVPELPTLAELDRAAGGARVYLARVDVHSALVSSALAGEAGLASLPGWDGSALVRREAHHAARDAVRDVPPARRRELQAAALAAASAAGIGCVHECSAPHVGSPADARDLLALAAEPDTCDVLLLWGQLARDTEQVAAILAELALPEPARLLGLGGDLMLDGSIGSATAAFTDAYTDAPRRAPVLEAGQVRDHVVATTRAGVQAGFHVIGDAALGVALEGFEQAAHVLGPGPLAAGRHRLEHVEAADAGAVTRLAALGVTASVQPAFDARWGGPDGMYARRLGAERAARLNPFAALAAAGVPLAFGSDSPVTTWAPWEAVRAAAFPHHREHAVSVRAAFLASTRGGWRAAGRDGHGVLVPGAAATYAVWAPSDLLVQAPDDRFSAWSTDARSGTPGLPDLTPGTPAPACLRTVVGGRTTHEDVAWAAQAAAAARPATPARPAPPAPRAVPC